jgi:hypothetical protein
MYPRPKEEGVGYKKNPSKVFRFFGKGDSVLHGRGG